MEKKFKEFNDVKVYLSKQSKEFLVGLLLGITRGDPKKFHSLIKYLKKKSK